MKRKIVGIILMLILISSSLSLCVEAGSEENPEIEDETGECHRSIDIESAWFFEKPDEPEYLHVNMKLANYKISRIGRDFRVYFKINNETYYVTLLFPVIYPLSYYTLTHEIRNGSRVWYDDYFIYGHVNKINSIISWKVPKSLIGNPEAGDFVKSINADSFYTPYFLSRAGIPVVILDAILKKIFNKSVWDFMLTSELPFFHKLFLYVMKILDYSYDSAESKGKDYIFQY